LKVRAFSKMKRDAVGLALKEGRSHNGTMSEKRKRSIQLAYYFWFWAIPFVTRLHKHIILILRMAALGIYRFLHRHESLVLLDIVFVYGFGLRRE
jgi:hypothetical protein